MTSEPEKSAKKIELNAIPLLNEHYDGKKQYNNIRRINLLKIMGILNDNEDFKKMTKEDKWEIVNQLELVICDVCQNDARKLNIKPNFDNNHYVSMYNMLTFKYTSNLDPRLVTNPNFYKKYIAEKRFDQLKNASFVEMNHEFYEPLLKRLQAGREAKINVKTSTLYVCPRCHQNKTTYQNMYDRAFDESQNIQVICENCKHIFKR